MHLLHVKALTILLGLQYVGFKLQPPSTTVFYNSIRSPTSQIPKSFQVSICSTILHVSPSYDPYIDIPCHEQVKISIHIRTSSLVHHFLHQPLQHFLTLPSLCVKHLIPPHPTQDQPESFFSTYLGIDSRHRTSMTQLIKSINNTKLLLPRRTFLIIIYFFHLIGFLLHYRTEYVYRSVFGAGCAVVVNCLTHLWFRVG